MAKVILNDASSFHPKGLATTMVIDATNNLVSADGAVDIATLEAVYFQIQVQVTGGAKFTLDGTDPTSATPFLVDDKFTAVWPISTLRNSRWSRQSADGTLIIQGVEA